MDKISAVATNLLRWEQKVMSHDSSQNSDLSLEDFVFLLMSGRLLVLHCFWNAFEKTVRETACWTYLFRKANNQAILHLAHQRLEEILAAGSQHSPVPTELLALHQDSHIAQDILLPLVIQAEEDIGTMNSRLIHIHGGFRLLIHGHSAHALEIEAQHRGVSLQLSP